LPVFQQNSRPQASRMQLGGTESAARETGAEAAEEYDALAEPFIERA
jgi:hypothetical protein